MAYDAGLSNLGSFNTSGPMSFNVIDNPSPLLPPSNAVDAATAIGALGLGTQALGAIQGAFGAYYQGRIMRSQLKLQAAISEINAKVAENAAQMALLRGQRAEGISRLKTAQLKSDQKVALAANGVDLTGSPSVDNILGTTDFMGELDALTINQNAVADANNFRTQSANYGAQATMSAAQASGVNPGLQVYSSLLGDAGQFARSAYQYYKNFSEKQTDKQYRPRLAASQS